MRTNGTRSTRKHLHSNSGCACYCGSAIASKSRVAGPYHDCAADCGSLVTSTWCAQPCLHRKAAVCSDDASKRVPFVPRSTGNSENYPALVRRLCRSVDGLHGVFSGSLTTRLSVCSLLSHPSFPGSAENDTRSRADRICCFPSLQCGPAMET